MTSTLWLFDLVLWVAIMAVTRRVVFRRVRDGRMSVNRVAIIYGLVWALVPIMAAISVGTIDRLFVLIWMLGNFVAVAVSVRWLLPPFLDRSRRGPDAGRRR